MKQRIFGNTGKSISEIGLGTWQLGTRWGNPFNPDEARKILETAEETGITFVDTADVYNGGKSEEAIGEYLAERPGRFFVTTKCGRRLNPHTAEMYTPEAVRGFIEGSLSRMKAEQLDLILLHCPPTPVYRRDDIFGELERQKAALNMLTATLRNYFRDDPNLNLFCLHPGWIRTNPGNTEAPLDPYEHAETLRLLFETKRHDKEGPAFITYTGEVYPW